MAEVSSLAPSVHRIPVEKSSLHGSKKPIVPPLALHTLSSGYGFGSGGISMGSGASVAVLHPKEFLDSILQSGRSNQGPRPPPRPSPRVVAWKKKAAVLGRMDWDTMSSSRGPSTSSRRLPLSTKQRISSRGRPDEKRKLGTMAPSMFAKVDAKNLLILYREQANEYVEKFKKPAPPSRTVPSSFPGYRLHRRVQGTWAYQPPDTRQEALNAWFLKHLKRPPPPIHKVHVAFGRVTYPSEFSMQPGTEVPEPVIEPPKMTVVPRKGSVSQSQPQADSAAQSQPAS